MKITIEPETDEEKAQPQNKRVILTGLAAIAMVAIPAEEPEQTALYFSFRNNLPQLQQRVSELAFQLTKARFVTEAAQAQQPPLIKVAQPNIPFPGGNDRMR